jgi:uncharacterized protein (UPF0335 family)
MAKKMSQDKAAAPKSRAGSNGFDPEVLNSLAERIENVEAEGESDKGAYMQRCKARNEDIADIVEEGKARGIPPKPFKKALRARKLSKKIEALRADLDDMVDRESYDQIRLSLGDLADLPLGEAALKGKEPEGEKDVRPGFLRKDETAERVAANVAALKGIKPLPPDGPSAA